MLTETTDIPTGPLSHPNTPNNVGTALRPDTLSNFEGWARSPVSYDLPVLPVDIDL